MNTIKNSDIYEKCCILRNILENYGRDVKIFIILYKNNN